MEMTLDQIGLMLAQESKSVPKMTELYAFLLDKILQAPSPLSLRCRI